MFLETGTSCNVLSVCTNVNTQFMTLIHVWLLPDGIYLMFIPNLKFSEI